MLLTYKMDTMQRIFWLALSVKLVILLSAAGLQAQPQLINDINTSPYPSKYNPYEFIDFEGKLYFRAFSPETGEELFMYDPLLDSVLLAIDINPGNAGSSPADLIEFEGKLYFRAQGFSDPYNLYISDGTAEGTIKFESSDTSFWQGVSKIVKLDTVLIILGSNSNVGGELWATDGTIENTRFLRDIYPGPTGSATTGFTVFQNELYFRANSPDFGYELWKTDGTPEGTILVKDITSGPTLSFPDDFKVFKNYLYFNARPDGTNTKLYRTDGTPEGTTLFKNLNNSTTSSAAFNMTPMDSVMFFTSPIAYNKYNLWITDGTNEGTEIIVNGQDNGIYNFLRLFPADSILFMNAYEDNGDIELWKYSLETGKLTKFDINPGNSASNPANHIDYDEKIYFSAITENHGRELWYTDGTISGTEMVVDLNPGTTNGGSFYMFPFNNLLFFNGIGNLVKTDGTAAGTIEVSQPIWNNGSGAGLFSDLVRLGENILFGAADSLGFEIWKMDQNHQNITQVKDIYPGPENGINSLSDITLNQNVYFSGVDSDHGIELWVSDGTDSGTHILKDIYPGPGNGIVSRSLQIWKDQIIFPGNSPNEGYELWISDGTEEGTRILKDIVPGSTGSFPNIAANFKELKDIFLFSANIQDYGTELWRSDGSDTGTYMLKDIYPGPGYSQARSFSVFKDKVCFLAYDETNGVAIWETDGTSEGTVIFFDPNGPGDLSFSISGIYPLNERIIFLAQTDSTGAELFYTDGTKEGTGLLIDMIPGPENGRYQNFIKGDSGYFYAGVTNEVGNELFFTDGTPEGTMLVKDIAKGPAWSQFENFVLLNSKLYFSANDGINGKRLWVSDGTEKGTHFIEGSPINVARVHALNGKIYFSALDNEHGYELWVYQPETEHFIEFETIEAKSYGDQPFALEAIASSGLEVSYHSSDESIATVTGNTVTIQNAGETTITASQQGNETYPAASPVSQTLIINKASLTITARDTSKMAGEENPEFSFEIDGFVYEEDASVIDQLPIITTTANLESPQGTYPITLTGGSDNNYELNLVNGTLTILPLTGIQGHTGNQFRIYPVPTNNILNIETELAEDLVYKIIDISGALIQDGNVAGGTINLGGISRGIYLLELNNRYRFRIVVN